MSGRLPLLAHALHQTWQHREGRRLTVTGYQATGGINGAVAQAADAVYGELDQAGKDAARRLLLRLVSLGEGSADTRRRVAISDLTPTASAAAADPAQIALNAFVQARLLTTDVDAEGSDTTEITHEALLSAWPRLRQWLSQDREGLRIHQDLTEATHTWIASGKDLSDLYTGTRLALTREWAARHPQDLNPDEQAFLAAASRQQRRSRLIRRAAVAALAVLTAVSAATAGLAIHENYQAKQARNQAEQNLYTAVLNQVIAQAGQVQDTDPSLAAQLDLVAHRMRTNPDSTTRLLSTTQAALANPLMAGLHPETLLCVFNVSAAPQVAHIRLPSFTGRPTTDVFGGSGFRSFDDSGSTKLTLGRFNFFWHRL